MEGLGQGARDEILRPLVGFLPIHLVDVLLGKFTDLTILPIAHFLSSFVVFLEQFQHRVIGQIRPDFLTDFFLEILGLSFPFIDEEILVLFRDLDVF